MVICNLNELDRGQYEEKFGEVDWRELSYTYMDIMQKLVTLVFNILLMKTLFFRFISIRCLMEKQKMKSY